MEDSREFVFVGDSLALDLINTEVIRRGVRCDLLESPAHVADWWEQARQRHPASAHTAGLSGADARLLAETVALRSALRRICDQLVLGQPAASADLAVINRLLAVGRHVLGADPAGRISASYAIEGGDQQGLLFALALAALELLTVFEPERLHRCNNERCILYFYDTTKSATRRWCSTACMNRARSRQHYLERKRQADS
jgi:predicted RNA-binding Zn ribbon-like protein